MPKFLNIGFQYESFEMQITSGCLELEEESPSCLLKAILFSVFPWRSLELYWISRKASLAGFHASVSIPLRIPTNFLPWRFRVEWRPFPPCKNKTRQFHQIQKQYISNLGKRLIILLGKWNIRNWILSLQHHYS